MAKEKLPVGAYVLPSTIDAKREATNVAIDKMREMFKDDNIIMNMGGQVGKIIPSYPTNIPELDLYALGCGGVPRGRIIEFFGPESGGKTTLALHCIACAQQQGELAAFVDAEHSLDPTWASRLKVDVDNLLISQPDWGEQGLEVVHALCESGGVGIVVVDSVSSLVPRAELENEMGSAQPGMVAKMMAQALRKIEGVANKTGTTVIFINQIREKIGVMFGNPETTSGGRALRHAGSVRVDIRRIAYLKDGGEKSENPPFGQTIRAKVVKNKCGPPHRVAEFDLNYETGFDGGGSLLRMSLKYGFAEKSGSWYSYRGERIGQGITNAGRFLSENPELFQKMLTEVKSVALPQKQ
jgi:recombination protein RecA